MCCLSVLQPFPSLVNVGEDGASAFVQKGILSSQAASLSRVDTINIDEEGEGVEVPLTSNAVGNCFADTGMNQNRYWVCSIVPWRHA